MPANAPDRPDPDALLAALQRAEPHPQVGRLKVWFGACPGVGKTFAMLSAAQRRRRTGDDVVVGYVETHGRAETEALLDGLELLPRRSVAYRGTTLAEFDLEAALARKPRILLLDELPHTNAPGSRFAKRWQDVETLRAAGIEVHTTLNVQHLESLVDVVTRLTGVTVRETVPDSVLESADEVELVDLPPETLLERLRLGKVYVPEATAAALDAFFQRDHVAALRELALRKTAQVVDRRRRDERQSHGERRARSTSERILVAVGPSPFAARLVRAAHRMAAVVRGELFAVHVAPPPGRRVAAADRERVLQHLRIAESLGARTASIDGPDPAAALTGFARRHEISRIVIGRTGRSRWRELLLGSFTMDVIRTSGDIDVYVIHDRDVGDRAAALPTPPESVPKSVGAPDWRAWMHTLCVTGAAIGIATALYHPPDLSVEALVLTLGVVLAALRGGRGPALVASLLSALAFNLLLTEPRFTFAIDEPSYLIAFAAMLTVGLCIASLVARTREHAVAAREREAEVGALHHLARELADAEHPEAVGRATVAHLRGVVSGDLAVIAARSGDAVALAGVVATHGATDWLDPAALAVARWSWDHGLPAGFGTGNLPGAAALFLPLTSTRGKEGILAVHPHQPHDAPDAKQRLLLDTFAEHASQAFERLALAEDRLRAHQAAELERLRSTLLASVSHDLRTPLATITGSASLLLEDTQTTPAHTELLRGIAAEAQRLNELIANLMFATRLQDGHTQVRREWTSIEELVGSAIARAQPNLARHTVTTAVATDLPLLQADPVLLEQALFLLLDNASKHTPPGTHVHVAAHCLGQELILDVTDDGPGIPAAMRPRVFHRFERGPGSSGMGLGLPICEAILRAHGGSAHLLPAAPRGAAFRLRLPLPDRQPELRAEDVAPAQERHG
jgi:two-component system sensor histidine kinase KdpD